MSRRFIAAGFTAAEMLVASAVAGIVAGTAALTLYTVTLAQRQYVQIASFTLPNGALSNFYPGQTGNSVNCAIAPNFSATAQAESLREKFTFDTSQAIGVYCLARNSGNYNTTRPTSITAPPAGTILDTPDGFRSYLGTLYSAAPTTFVSFRNFPATAPCLSVYVLGYSTNATSIPVTAVYDLDVVSAKDPLSAAVIGNYVAVRRYVNGALTAYYDCCFKLSGDSTDSWYPAVVSFERQARKAVTEGSSSIDRFKIAREKPFFLMFWPDPSRSSLRLPTGNTIASYNASLASTDPRKAYNHMAGRTSFMFVVPLFPLLLMNTCFQRNRSQSRGAALLLVMALTIIGGIAVTAWIYLLAARAIQVSRLSDSVVRHITWGNTAAINQQYNIGFSYRDNVTQPDLTATVTGGGGEVAAAYANLTAFASTNDYSHPSGFAAPFNNIRKQITADGSVYYTRTTGASDSSQTEHLLYYNFQKSYPRPLLGDLLIVYAKPSAAANTYITDNLKVNGRVLLYDSTADVTGVQASECLNLTKAGTNTTLDSSATSTLLPQNFPAIPLFTAGSSGAGTGAVLTGALNVLNNSSFTVNSLYDKMQASSLGYNNLSTSSTSGVNIESDSDSGSSSSAVWVDSESSGSFTYAPPSTSPYNYSAGSTLWRVQLLLKHSSLKHIRIVSGVEQLILKGQTNTTDYNTAGTLEPLIILVEQEIRDIRLVGENNRPIILAVGTGTGQVLYMGWSGTNVTGSGALRWRLHLVNQYRNIYLDPPSGNNVTLTGSIRTNWSINCTDGTATDRFFLNTEASPGTLATLLPRDAWFEPLIVQ